MAMERKESGVLRDGSVVAIVGGGPAGSFTALHLLQMAEQLGVQLNVRIFERRLKNGSKQIHYDGCPQCAGGISPKLNEALQGLDIELPADVIQSSIETITLQGRWKNLHLAVPTGRKMLSVYRGALPHGTAFHHQAFDALLLDHAKHRGATVSGGQVQDVFRDTNGNPVLIVQEQEKTHRVGADFVVFATGINDSTSMRANHTTGQELLGRLCAGYRPPRLRKALIFELEGASPGEFNEGELHYVECTERGLQLEMCSILPKREYLTISLIGRSVDRAKSHRDNLEIIRRFLALPRIRRSLPQDCSLKTRCACSPRIVVGSASKPTADRVAAVGDMVACRQYKDGILSAHAMSRSLAYTLLNIGTDNSSLQQGYVPTLTNFRRDNRYATVIFALYRLFFSNHFLSRVLYQTYSTEQKKREARRRYFEQLLWAISSGDESYGRILWWMIRPRTLWQIFSTGLVVTLWSIGWEKIFGLHWRGLGRFPVVVKQEQISEQLGAYPTIKSRSRVYLYGIDIKQDSHKVLKVLHRFGETDRPFLTPRMVVIQRRQGCLAEENATIDYRIFGGLIRFAVVQVPSGDPYILQFKVKGGFAHDGDFLFSISPTRRDHTRLSVLLSFDYPAGSRPVEAIFWRLFALLFPDSIHEIIWNHALCELKQASEKLDPDIIASLPERLTV